MAMWLCRRCNCWRIGDSCFHCEAECEAELVALQVKDSPPSKVVGADTASRGGLRVDCLEVDAMYCGLCGRMLVSGGVCPDECHYLGSTLKVRGGACCFTDRLCTICHIRLVRRGPYVFHCTNCGRLSYAEQCSSCAKFLSEQPKPSSKEVDMDTSAEYVVVTVKDKRGRRIYGDFEKAAKAGLEARHAHEAQRNVDAAKHLQAAHETARVVIAKVVAEVGPPGEPKIKIKDLRARMPASASAKLNADEYADTWNGLPDIAIRVPLTPSTGDFLKPTRSWWSHVLHGMWNGLALAGLGVWGIVLLRTAGCM